MPTLHIRTETTDAKGKMVAAPAAWCYLSRPGMGYPCVTSVRKRPGIHRIHLWRPEKLNLPNARYARVEKEKITGYLLSTTSPDGRGKAKFFFRFGFRVDQWQNLADALRIQGTSHKVVEIIETAFGPRYHVDGIIETPDGRNPKIKTVWQVDIGSNSPRLITAHPLGG